MWNTCVGVVQTIIGVAFGAFDAIHLQALKPKRLSDNLVVYSPKTISPTCLVLVAPPLLGSHKSPNVASVVRACLQRGWMCAIHDRQDDPPNIFGNTDSLVQEFRLVKRFVPDSVGHIGVIGMSTGSFQAARCLHALAENGACGVVLMANALTLEHVDRHSSPGSTRYICNKISSHLRIPCPRSKKLSDLCTALGVDPRQLDCRCFLLESKIPTLCINSMNDPVVPKCVLPILKRIAARNKNIRVWGTLNGGHLGWVGLLGRRYAIQRSLDFVADCRSFSTN